MLKAFYAQYSEATELLVYDRNRLVHKVFSTEGVRQGDFAARAFALTVQSLLQNVRCRRQVSLGNLGCLGAGMDGNGTQGQEISETLLQSRKP